MIKNFLQELRTQRWVTIVTIITAASTRACTSSARRVFLVAYVMVFIDPVVSRCFGWLVSMTSRQAGHFFFEPRGYDHVNHASHEHQGRDQVGYNLAAQGRADDIWALSPVVPFSIRPCSPFQALGLLADFARQVAKVLARGRDRRSPVPHRPSVLHPRRRDRLVWMTKIITDPFNDLRLYHKAPLYLAEGELIDPGLEKHVRHA